jgi:peptidoglycan/xylan/chitin deacetylase (PgdA/CDA1 family)
MVEIWFDDGLRDVYVHFAPIMEKYGLTGIIPLVTDCVGGKFKWYLDKTRYIELPCMTIEEIRELMSKGWKIASHTKTHRRLTELSLEEVEEEFKGSKEWIEKNLGVTPEDLVCPWNAITEEQKKIALKYYRRVMTSDRIYFHAVNLPPPDNVFTLEIFDGIVRKWRLK